jgi:hypothetical protein
MEAVMSKRQEQTKKFSASSENGDTFTIIETTTVHEVPTRGGSRTARGQKRLQTTEGYPVNRKDKGVYEVLHPLGDVIVRSDDPKAP